MDTTVSRLHHKPFVFQDFSETLPMRQSSKAEAEPAPVQPEEPAPPSFSEEELSAAQREAEAIGRQKGYEDAKREWDEQAMAREVQLLTLLENLTARLDVELAGQEQLRTSQRADMANIVLMIARKLVGSAMESQPLGAIEPIVNECLTMLAGEAKLAIEVCTDLKAPLEKYVATLQRQGQALEIIADAQMQAGDCRIQWPGGKAERNQEALWQEMEKIVMRALVAPTDKNE